MALRDGKPWMAFGTPGGEQQDQWSLIFFAAHGASRPDDPAGDRRAELPFRALAEQLLAARRATRQAGAGRALSATVLEELRARGHRAELGEEWSEGRLSAARIEPDGQMFAGANARGMQGYAVGR